MKAKREEEKEEFIYDSREEAEAGLGGDVTTPEFLETFSMTTEGFCCA